MELKKEIFVIMMVLVVISIEGIKCQNFVSGDIYFDRTATDKIRIFVTTGWNVGTGVGSSLLVTLPSGGTEMISLDSHIAYGTSSNGVEIFRDTYEYTYTENGVYTFQWTSLNRMTGIENANPSSWGITGRFDTSDINNKYSSVFGIPSIWYFDETQTTTKDIPILHVGGAGVTYTCSSYTPLSVINDITTTGVVTVNSDCTITVIGNQLIPSIPTGTYPYKWVIGIDATDSQGNYIQADVMISPTGDTIRPSCAPNSYVFITEDTGGVTFTYSIFNADTQIQYQHFGETAGFTNSLGPGSHPANPAIDNDITYTYNVADNGSNKFGYIQITDGSYYENCIYDVVVFPCTGSSAPVITCPTDILVDADGNCEGTVNSFVATSHCDVLITHDYVDPVDETRYPIGIITNILSPVNDIILVTDVGVIKNIEVFVDIIHTDMGNIEISLLSPDGTTIQLLDNRCSQIDFMGTFTDDGVSNSCVGDIEPIDTLSTLNGENSNGIWTITIIDSSFLGTGIFKSWTLNIEIDAIGSDAAGTYPIGITTVTFTADDGFNTDVCTSTVTVVDNIAPIITCPFDVTMPADGDCEANILTFQAIATDNCGAIVSNSLGAVASTIEIETSISGAPLDDLAPPVVDTITIDDYGLILSVEVYVEITHTNMGDIDIVLESPAGTIIQLFDRRCGTQSDFVGTFTDTGTLNACTGDIFPESLLTVLIGEESRGDWKITVTDNEAGNTGTFDNWTLTIFQDILSDAFGVYSLGTTSVSFTANDGVNTEVCVSTVTVTDVTPPDITCPADVTVSANAICEGDVNPFMATAIDNCVANPTIINDYGGTLVASQTISESSSPTFILSSTVILPVVDTITIVDIGVITNVEVYVEISHTNVGDLEISLLSPDGTTFQLIDNRCGSQIDFIGTFTDTGVVDGCNGNTAPEDPLSVLNGSFSNGVWSLIVVDNNLLGGTGSFDTWTLNIDIDIYGADAADSYPLGTTVVSFQVSDGPNSDFCSSKVTVIDDTNPTITCPSDLFVSADAFCEGDVSSFQVTASDNCNEVTVTNSLGFGSPETVTRTSDPIISISQALLPGVDVILITDLGFVTNVQVYVEITHTDVSDLHISLLSPSLTLIELFDNRCGSQVDFIGTFTDTGVANGCNGNIVPEQLLSTLNGESITGLWSIIILDNVIGGGTGTLDSWSLILNAEDMTNPTGTFPLGTTSVTYTVSDGTLTDTCSATITVGDDTPPNITCPLNLVGSANVDCEYSVSSFLATATDNCSTSPSITNSYNSGGAEAAGIYNLGTTSVTFTASDGTNSESCNVVVTVNDNIDPVLTCPADQIVSSTTSCSISVTLVPASLSDNCGTGTITNSHNSGGADASDTYPAGTTVVNFVGSDTSGNSVTCSTSISVISSVLAITCPAPSTTNVDSGSCFSSVSSLVATHNCGSSVTISNDYNTGGADASDFYPVGTTTVTFTATDGTDTVSCSVVVEVIDNEDPVPGITSAFTVTLNQLNSFTYTIDISDIETSSNDNCAISSTTISGDLTYTFSDFLNYHNGETYTVTLESTDESGNTSTRSLNIDVAIPTSCGALFTNPPNFNVEYMYMEFNFEWMTGVLSDDWLLDLEIYSEDSSTYYRDIILDYQANINFFHYIGFHQLIPYQNFQIRTTFHNDVNGYSYGPICGIILNLQLRDWSLNP